MASMYYLLHGPRSLRARILCDELETDGIFSAIVAVSHSGIRGVFRPCPAARNTDGKIDLCLFGARHPTGRRLTPREVLRTAWGTITGRHVEEPWVTAFQSRGEVLIHLTEPHSFQGDGDTLCEGCDFALRPLPNALEVIL
jgi:diacylglycerol kinase family enzyme